MKIFLTPSLNSYPKQIRAQKPQEALDVIALKKDTFSFTGSARDDKLKAQGCKILEKFDSFSPAEYEKLSQDEIKLMRKVTFSKPHRQYFKDIMFANDLLEQSLNKKYPNGFVFVSIGRSPAPFAKILEHHGYNVKFCPSISLQREYFRPSEQYLKKYSEYLNSVGITHKEVKESKVPFLFTDYTSSGGSLKNFEKILLGNGIKRSENAKFVSLNKDLLGVLKKPIGMYELLTEDSITILSQTRIEKFVTSYLFNAGIKCYSPVPSIPGNYAGSVVDYLKNYKESYRSQFMSFHVIDSFKKTKEGFLSRILKHIF